MKVAEEILDLIKDVGLFTYDFITTPYGKLRINNMSGSNFYRHIRKLKTLGLVEQKRKGRDVSYKISKKGLVFLSARPMNIERNDGLFTLIIFDIPISKNKERTILRRYLRKNGYDNLQKSVFISKYLISGKIKQLLKELKLMNYVNIFSVKFELV